MKSKYSIGFFVGALIFMFMLSAVYEISYNRQFEKKEAELLKSEESISTKGTAEKNKGYYLCELNGYIVVYLSDKKTLYEMTDITLDRFPQEVQNQIKSGKYVENEEILYGILENYSS